MKKRNKYKITMKYLKKYLNLLKILFTNKTLILNYQMGKVGSSTVARFLRENNYFEWHIHRFTNIYYTTKRKKNIIPYILDYLFLKLFLIKKQKIKVVSGFREPISRNVSMYFQNLTSDYLQHDISKYNIEDLIINYGKKFPHLTPIKWFEEEFKNTLDIDIFKSEFDKKEGYVICKNDNIEIFLYKLEKLDSLEREIASFLEIDDYKLIKSNSSSNKWYSEIYKEFKKTYNPSEYYIKELYSSRTMKFFYTESQIEKFKNKWGK